MIQYILHIFQLSSIYEINLLQQCVPSKPWKQPDLSWNIFPILRFYFKFKEWAFHRYALLISRSTTRSMKFLYLIKFMTLHGKCCSLYRRVYEVKSLLSPNILSAGTLAFVYVSSWVLCQCFRSVTLRKWTSINTNCLDVTRLKFTILQVPHPRIWHMQKFAILEILQHKLGWVPIYS